MKYLSVITYHDTSPVVWSLWFGGHPNTLQKPTYFKKLTLKLTSEEFLF